MSLTHSLIELKLWLGRGTNGYSLFPKDFLILKVLDSHNLYGNVKSIAKRLQASPKLGTTKMSLVTTPWIPLGNGKGRTADAHHGSDGLQVHYAKRKQPALVDHVLYNNTQCSQNDKIVDWTEHSRWSIYMKGSFVWPHSFRVFIHGHLVLLFWDQQEGRISHGRASDKTKLFTSQPERKQSAVVPGAPSRPCPQWPHFLPLGPIS